jgi:isoquinoline 1-oxidoreductase subunit beta
MQTTKNIDRRNFLKLSGLTGAALVLGLNSKAADITSRVLNLSTADSTLELTPFVIIEKSGLITIMNPRPDMGQGTFQAIPALIAEELEVALDQVRIKFTSGDPRYGEQDAGGSYSVRGSYFAMRKIGASAREMLIKAAGMKWNVPVSECYADNAKIIHRTTGNSLGYGELAETASGLEVPKEPKLKDPKDFRILGKSIARPDIPLKVSGKAQFGIDAEIPGMVFASIERSIVFGSKLVSYDDTLAMNVKGVQKVLKTKRVIGKNQYDGVAVVADNYWAAFQGRKELKIQWDHQGFDKFNSTEYEQKLRDISKSEGIVVHNQGDFEKAMTDSPVKIEAFYETPMVSHSPMEPMNCVADWKDGKVEVWVSSQGPNLVKDELSTTLGISKENIKVNNHFSGGGFGRRLLSDFAAEAALISKEIGKPVKVIWTREDDTRLGPFRPMTFSAMKGGLSGDGKVLAFQHKVISPSIEATLQEKFNVTKENGSMVEGISDQKYEFPNMKNAYVYSEIHIPLYYWRAVTSTTLAFAHESFIDEMAVKAGKDPMDFRLSLLTKDSDTKKVLQKLREVSGWDKKLPVDHGRGVAVYEFFAGLCGHVVEVTKLDNGGVKIDKVYSVIDLGTVVNPDNVRAQVEGAIVMAIVAATKDGIVFENGSSKQANFNNNRMLKINEMPEVDVHIIADGGPKIKGVGEPGLPPLAPALTNAIFSVTGVRIRRLPFDINKI